MHFQDRHIGISLEKIREIVHSWGEKNFENWTSEAIPESLRPLKKSAFSLLSKLHPTTEENLLAELAKLGSYNRTYRSFVGQGFYQTKTPEVIRRCFWENPAWYTAYTPYQAEISQGRLELLLNFQTLVSDLTELPIANASLLDEANASVEAVLMAYRSLPRSQKNRKILIAHASLPLAILDVLKTRLKPIGLELFITSEDSIQIDNMDSVFALIFPQIDRFGTLLSEKLWLDIPAIRIAQLDLLAASVLQNPVCDIAFGNSQRMGVPMGFGGPHAAFLAAKENFKRIMPGRIIGISKDKKGNLAYRMALQTREQHIRRETATSNICTAQALLAMVAALYAMYHGPSQFSLMAQKVIALNRLLSKKLKEAGAQLKEGESILSTGFYADKILSERLIKLMNEYSIALYHETSKSSTEGDWWGIALDETTTLEEWLCLGQLLKQVFPKINLSKEDFDNAIVRGFISRRSSQFWTHPMFHKYQSETEMMRFIRRLAEKDYALDRGMIPLGSCTMKLNSATSMTALSNPAFTNCHPFAPLSWHKGYIEIIRELKEWLADLTGFAATSLQPNSGAQGELAGLLTIRNFHQANNQDYRDIVLIPTSAHGTNPASAVLAGYKVVSVQCDKAGNIDIDSLRSRIDEYSGKIAAFMVTYPSTHGVFETNIRELTAMIHQAGALVYMDGANLNAQVAWIQPADLGADVCHINLHKTFAIPHGGGGPGMGPICVTKELEPWLPSHRWDIDEGKNRGGVISNAPFGSALILTISWAYIRMLGFDGLKNSTLTAVFAANYLAQSLKDDYEILYQGKNGWSAHEFIIDLRPFKISADIEVDDVAKRLMDYGFHAPTVSFPVPGTIMIEPSESESLEELDRFVKAMKNIRSEIAQIEMGEWNKKDNPLKNAPHTAIDIEENWSYNYDMKTGLFPNGNAFNKYWPTVSRIDQVYGDQNLICTAPFPSSEN